MFGYRDVSQNKTFNEALNDQPQRLGQHYSVFFKIRILLLILWACGSLTFAQSPNLSNKTGKFLITKWTTEDGLPQNSVTSIVQTEDGYIWLGTFGGLARFDGIKFTIFDTANTPALNRNRIMTLFEDSWKTLWIGTETGDVFTLSGGKVEEIHAVPDFKRGIILGFQQDGNGDFYIASRGGLEKFRFDETGKVMPKAEHLLGEENTIFKDAEQRIWTKVRNKFFIVADGGLIPADARGFQIPPGVEKIHFAAGGKIFAGGDRSFGVIENSGYRKILSVTEPISRNYFDIVYKNGTCWFQEKDYLVEWNGTEAIRHDLSKYVESGSRVIFIDKEDNLWLGTSKDGLVKLTRRSLGLVGDLTDFEVKNTYSVVEDHNGAVWVAGLGLLKIEHGRVSRFTKTYNGNPVTIRSLAVDARGDLWVGDDFGLNIFRQGEFVPVPEFKDHKIDALFFDRSGTLWGGSSQGLYRFQDGKLEHFTTADGLVHDKVAFITQLGDGRIWIGTMGGMSIFSDGKFENYTTAQGLSGNYVREIFEDADGNVWIGTYGGGIDRLRDGAFRAITKENGLHDNFISRILADDAGRFWILGNQGIFAVSRDELNAVAEGSQKTLLSAVYGTSGELKYSEGSGGHQPAGYRTSDGRIWFPMIEDMVIFDPAKLVGTPPAVVIEKASSKAGGEESRSISTITSDPIIQIEDGLRNLEIEYTGLSFVKPEKIRFYYKLDGLDKDWIDAGTRRTAFYPYLPSGEYMFHVKAVTLNGVWSETPATIKINVAKSFWQTGWFIGMLVFVAAAAIILIYWLRLKQLERKQLQQMEFAKRLINAHETERRRIATELHDGLGQNLLIIKNWALHGLENLKKTREVKEHLEKISETAANSLSETRAIVGNLSPQNLKRFGLTEAINNMVEQIEDSSGVVFAKNIENIDGIFSDETEISIYRIVQECLNNIIKHSESPRGEIRINRFSGEVEIMIRDFGRGFSTEKQIVSENGTSGFGLRSIAQRTELLGGELSLDSTFGEGTVIRVRIKI